MSNVFDAYAAYYDLLYRDKDYSAEAAYVASRIRERAPEARSILDLGCGTGAHAEELARLGFVVTGIDRSETMLARAAERKRGLPSEVAGALSFSCGDVTTVRTGTTYDAVISLFHVMSYQATDAALDAAFETAAAHLAPGGLFLFDYWYGPSVLTQRPEVRVKRLEDGEIRVTRIAEPTMHLAENLVDIDYTMFIEQKSTGRVDQVHETHRMRYFFLPELARCAGAGFEAVASHAWMADDAPHAGVWAGLSVYRRLDS